MKISRSPSVDGRPNAPALKSPRVTTSSAPANPPTRPITFHDAEPLAQHDPRQHRGPERRQPDQPARIRGRVSVSAIRLQHLMHEHADEPHQRQLPPRRRGGNSRTSASSTSAPIANRQKINVTGDTSRRAAFVATNEIPQKTTAMKARKRGDKHAGSMIARLARRRQRSQSRKVVAADDLSRPLRL